MLFHCNHLPSSSPMQPPGVFGNGMLDLDPHPKLASGVPEGGVSVTPPLPPLAHTQNNVATR